MTAAYNGQAATVQLLAERADLDVLDEVNNRKRSFTFRFLPLRRRYRRGRQLSCGRALMETLQL
jgi:hypothetical protein